MGFCGGGSRSKGYQIGDLGKETVMVDSEEDEVVGSEAVACWSKGSGGSDLQMQDQKIAVAPRSKDGGPNSSMDGLTQCGRSVTTVMLGRINRIGGV